MQDTTWILPIGARPDQDGVHFRVWAADASHVEVVLYDEGATAAFALAPEPGGYFAGCIAGIGPGARYMYRLNSGDPRPDPASRFQPNGVHSVSQVVDPAAFEWTDGDWRGIPLEDAIIYELHVGTATETGTFDALIERLDDLRNLGVTVIELMPVADFPGARNWGYDGVNLFAPARAYGGPEALRRLVDAAHARGLAVLLDVVYNHLGPDGNYLRQFSQQYFTNRHHTPWGEALNLDGPGSAPVRAFFIANACYWAHEYHIDGLRLDATHALIDTSTTHLLAELTDAVHASLPPNRHFLLIADN
jgi:maltooligosyltrehalose trehalohydrolase